MACSRLFVAALQVPVRGGARRVCTLGAVGHGHRPHRLALLLTASISVITAIAKCAQSHCGHAPPTKLRRDRYMAPDLIVLDATTVGPE